MWTAWEYHLGYMNMASWLLGIESNGTSWEYHVGSVKPTFVKLQWKGELPSCLALVLQAQAQQVASTVEIPRCVLCFWFPSPCNEGPIPAIGVWRAICKVQGDQNGRQSLAIQHPTASAFLQPQAKWTHRPCRPAPTGKDSDKILTAIVFCLKLICNSGIWVGLTWFIRHFPNQYDHIWAFWWIPSWYEYFIFFHLF